MEIVKNLNKETLEENIRYQYTYTLVKDTIKVIIDSKEVAIQSYGIKAERKDIKKENSMNIDKDKIFNITPYRHKAEELLKLLYDNTVSPLHIVDILGEYVDNSAEDYDEYSSDKIIINS